MILNLQLPGRVRRGEPVHMTVTVENTAGDTVPLGLTGRPIAFDLTVTTPDGAEVWSRLHGRTVPMILQVALLEPGQRLEFSDTWGQEDNQGQPVDPGIYLVRGVLPTEDGTITTAARQLSIAP